jgi:hypothetical protein
MSVTDSFQLRLTVDRQTVVGTFTGEDADGRPLERDAEAPFNLDELRREMVNVLVDRLREESIRSVELELLGKILYRALFDGDVEELFHESRREFQRYRGRDARLPLQLEFEHDDLIAYPWEFLHGPVVAGTEPSFLSTSEKVVLSRYAPGREEWESVEAPKALKTLLITSLPRDILERLPPGTTTYDPLVDKIKAIPSLEVVDPVLANPTKQDIEHALDDHEPHVIHYIGHGRRVEEAENRFVGEIALCEGDEPRCRWIPYPELVGSFQRAKAPPRLVVLHLCPGPRAEGGFVARASFTELAHRLSRVPIQAVLGMQYPLAIDQDLTQGFTETFYKRIAEHGSVAAAIQASRSFAYNQSAAANNYGLWNIGKPVLYMSTERLMTPPSASQPDGSQRAASQGQRDGERYGDARERSDLIGTDTIERERRSERGLFAPPARRQPSPRGGAFPV